MRAFQTLFSSIRLVLRGLVFICQASLVDFVGEEGQNIFVASERSDHFRDVLCLTVTRISWEEKTDKVL